MEDLFGGNIEEKEDSSRFFADVIIPVPIPKMFTYKIPKNFRDEIGIGFRVIVQFGKKKVLTGVIAKVHQKPPAAYEAKPILDLLDNHATVNPLQIRFWAWMAEYYCCNIGDVMNAALPSGLKLSSESKIQVNPTFDQDTSPYPLDDREETLLQALANKGELSYEDCESVLGIKSIHPIIKSLVIKEAILVFEQVKEKYSPKVESRIRLSKAFFTDKKKLEKLFHELSSKPKQEEVLLKYLQEVPVYRQPELNSRGLEKSVFSEAGLSASSLKTLIKNGVLEEYKLIISRFQEAAPSKEEITLSEYQEKALVKIKEELQEKNTLLLHGITGSGKTEIYITLIKEALASGSQVLMLLPEIALTTHMVGRLRQVFGSSMGVYHSKYSDNERVEVWNGVLSGKLSFVLGVRSSIFLPFDSLGLVIVDEEHESSFKQFDPAPRFQARDAAIMLAWLHQAKTILGSATPSFESFYNARTQKYGYVALDRRYGEAQLPEYILSDILVDKKKNLLKLDFTRLLRESIQEALKNQEQVLIFQNRRGYSPYISCEDCGWIPECEHCDVSLTYHQFNEEMRCHYCGFKEKVPKTCPACGSNKLSAVGLGTERIEESLSLLFPEARVARMDLDTTRSKFGYQRLLEEFGSGNVDILVGTQMITKGLDFDRVTVVGVMDADRILFFPDFRAGERAFQQITQVAGRAGRREKKGKVIIQTRKPEQQIFHQIIQGDYKNFYLQEMGDRQRFFYPPFVKIIKIVTRHKDYKVAERAARNLHHLMEDIPVKKILLGPEKGLIGKIKNQFIFETIAKLDKSGNAPAQFKQAINELINELQSHKDFRSVRFLIDVDPY
ncbi:Helicase PriA essential for oriC/DnaA-independent DNA replication [Indibacter alkaliphilus LW1]|uniref:Replication restart protein PriA n=1 Tax=Indibacter alkaliphilus (strain CCUG 57479 / KCTC 22604 / LW1) TaxID=1189612 RepID=S2DME1_INDAL|nr:primosomal protein N' [Indibacter alkaliphilus]EOZ98370.1 Helicase PriA essential for oriC/DnaA-independent DNA replication [Indibacter alkaliphilus LW1]